MNEIGTKFDKKFCKNASELENKFINYVKKRNVRNKFQNKYSEEIDKKAFNDFFDST